MLAVRAPESGPPALFNTGNRPAADRTGLPFAAVDCTSERKPPGFAAHAVKVMERRAARRNGGLQGFANRLQKSAGTRFRNGIRGPRRPNASRKQRF